MYVQTASQLVISFILANNSMEHGHMPIYLSYAVSYTTILITTIASKFQFTFSFTQCHYDYEVTNT